MKTPKYWKPILGITLAIVTIALYTIRWFAFSTPILHNELERFFIGDLAFMCFQILLVTVFLETYLKRREKEVLREKLNMIIGAFFSETGFDLLKTIAGVDRNSATLVEKITPQVGWTKENYKQAEATFHAYAPDIKLTPSSLASMKKFLIEHKTSILGLLANQSLLEHEQFADLLWATNHISDELQARSSLDNLPEADLAHLELDTKRAYEILALEWLEYLEHLSKRYPYLFALASRRSPFNPACRERSTR
ncbi:MAG: hypothetical protein JJE36_03515 [Coriobacteriia bacterium]|nr:hypothetical protein [Coriobacteriia bacterium]